MFLIVTNAVVPKYYNRKPPIGQPLFSHFCNWVSGHEQNPNRRDTPPGVSAPHRQKKDRVKISTSLRGAKRRGDRRECLWCNPPNRKTHQFSNRNIHGIATSGFALLAMTCSLLVPWHQKIPDAWASGIFFISGTRTAYRRYPRYRRPGCPWPPGGRTGRCGAGAGRSSSGPRSHRS